ncbi:hypothetical protein Dimus_031029 [Dionaea muscipula]
MLIERELSTSTSHGVESSETRLPQPDSGQNLDNPDAKLGFSQTGLEFLRESDVVYRGFGAKHSDAGNSCSQELTLRYLCENSKLDFSGRDFSSKGSLNFKRKDVILESSCQGGQDRWVERDFLHLSENHGSCYLKRDFQEETESGKEEEGKDKKAKIEALKLSLALPDDDISLSFIASSNPLQNGDPPPPPPPQPSRSLQSLAPSANNTQTTYSNDFTAASLSYSHSHPFSHNPSCSLTRNNSAENDQIWNCGEGTNGSVHSRFRPVGDGVALSNHGGTTAGVFALMNGGWPLNNKDPGNGIFKAAAAAAAAAAACSDTTSFYSSELPARPRLENLGGSDNLEGTGTRKVSKPERILQEIVSESIPVMALILEDVSDETMESTKRYLKILIDDAPPESRNNLVTLQKQLDRRSDLSRETLSKAHRTQLEVLVAIKFGLGDFVSGKFRVPSTELIEIFLLMRCRNVNCKYMLPVDDCDCKICSGTKGFCSQCMCPVCMKFDCANNTCSWVGCDVCSHWCHAACGIEKNLIRPGPSLKGHSGTTEMQFHCLGCGHASEMFGFVKDVFKYCAKDWGQRTLIKELDCVRKIFKGSEDVKGKQLYLRAEEIFSNLGSAVVSPSEACSFLIQFFNSEFKYKYKCLLLLLLHWFVW